MPVLGTIAIAAAIAVLCGAAAALAIGHPARLLNPSPVEPEAAGKVNSSLMFGLIMMETAVSCCRHADRFHPGQPGGCRARGADRTRPRPASRHRVISAAHRRPRLKWRICPVEGLFNPCGLVPCIRSMPLLLFAAIYSLLYKPSRSSLDKRSEGIAQTPCRAPTKRTMPEAESWPLKKTRARRTRQA